MKAVTTTPRCWRTVLNAGGTRPHSQPISIEFSQDDLGKMLKGFKFAQNYHGRGTADEFEPTTETWQSFIALLEENAASGAEPVAIELPTKYTLPDIYDFSAALNWAVGAFGPNAAHGGMYDLKLCYFLEDIYFQLFEIEEKLGLL